MIFSMVYEKVSAINLSKLDLNSDNFQTHSTKIQTPTDIFQTHFDKNSDILQDGVKLFLIRLFFPKMCLNFGQNVRIFLEGASPKRQKKLLGGTLGIFAFVRTIE